MINTLITNFWLNYLFANFFNSLLIVLHSSFILSLTSPLYCRCFTWLTPPGPYRATTCRERELTMNHIHIFVTTQGLEVSPDEGSAQCRGQLQDNTNMKDDKLNSRTHFSNKVDMKGWLWRPNDIRDFVGLKLLDICLTGEEKTRKKPHSGILSRPGIEPGPAA